MSPSMVTRILVLSSLALLACSTGRGARRDSGMNTDAPQMVVPDCNPAADKDNDGLADALETTADNDNDGTPNDEDLDSDNDGVNDIDELGIGGGCSWDDRDTDGLPNWIDTDSDNDGLSDGDERATFSTNPYAIDSDGDGVTDLGEARGTMTDPNDRASTIPEDDFFVVLPYFDPAQERQLQFGTDLQRADIYFLIDTTGSMQESIDNVTSSLSTIATQVRAEIPNVQMGVGQFRDFPDGAGIDIDSYGSAGDAPYHHEQDITDDISIVQTALGRLAAGGGADTPESSTEALYQTASGEGARWTFSSGAPAFDLMRRRCPAIPDELRMRRGYPCFRPDALPIIVHVTDAEFHNGPGGSNMYAGISPSPHNFDQAMSQLRGIGARFIGVAVGSAPSNDERQAATRTGTVDTSGNPLVYDATGGTVSNAIIEGIATLAGRTPQDVTTRTENVDTNPDGFDATTFIKAITPVEGYNGSASGPNPGITYTSRDDTTFFAVVPGTQVVFSVRFYNDVRPPAQVAQIFQATIIVIGNGVARLDSHKVYIIVPPDGATILI
jgi:hypothetical protein